MDTRMIKQVFLSCCAYMQATHLLISLDGRTRPVSPPPLENKEYLANPSGCGYDGLARACSGITYIPTT